MLSIDSLKSHLLGLAAVSTATSKRLSDEQYDAGFKIFLQGRGWETYQEFVLPQLSQLVESLLESRASISVLEIGPGPKSVLQRLPDRLRSRITAYSAYEHNTKFADKLEYSLCCSSGPEYSLSCFECAPRIHRTPFSVDSSMEGNVGVAAEDKDTRYDLVLFCHSLYGMSPKHKFIGKAIELLNDTPGGATVAIFHRDNPLHLENLIHQGAETYPNGMIQVEDNDQSLDAFTSFVAGVTYEGGDEGAALQDGWRRACRTLGHRHEDDPCRLLFSCPTVMFTYNNSSVKLSQLAAEVPLMEEPRAVKNVEARLHRPNAIFLPSTISHLQQCVRWALEHKVGLTVIGGGHSGQCLWPNVVAIDMAAFKEIHVITAQKNGNNETPTTVNTVVVAGTGCKTGDIIRETLAQGLTVPLGARPSVGAGLWLQGGIGHLARLHGLSCDSIVGAVLVSVKSSQILCVGHVPNQCWPAGASRPDNDNDLLWAIKGAGTNFGIVVSVVFKTYPAPKYVVRNWVFPLREHHVAQRKLCDFNNHVAQKLPRNYSADAYIYGDGSGLNFGVTMFEASLPDTASLQKTPPLSFVYDHLGEEHSIQERDSLSVFDSDMYMTTMHGGHGGGKTSSFKRCVFLHHIGIKEVASVLMKAVDERPSPLCYLHLLHGGGAVGDMTFEDTAFGCRDWAFACVVTGVWPRVQDGSDAEKAAFEWVYSVVDDLLPFCDGVYGADLGGGPRDSVLATRAFGLNRPRLMQLKKESDPYSVLAHACPLLHPVASPKLIVLVTGPSGVGKDYCAAIWESMFKTEVTQTISARTVSISDSIKRRYAAVSGADLERLLQDRDYKELHRPTLTAFFREQMHQRPELPKEEFLNVVLSATGVDVLIITGMREGAPVATFSPLLSSSKLLDIRVEAGARALQDRRGSHHRDEVAVFDQEPLDYQPSFVFDNNSVGEEAVKLFGKEYLLPYMHEDLQALQTLIPSVKNFPRPGVEFRHVLNISERPRGLQLCTSLLEHRFIHEWPGIDALVCCEAGGFIYASALASRVKLPLALIREAGKLPPPTISTTKLPSHITSMAHNGDVKSKRIEMGCDVLAAGASVVVVDDVLATGTTLCAVIELLQKARIRLGNIKVVVIAEFPIHGGRQLLRQRGFSRVSVDSLLVLNGA